MSDCDDRNTLIAGTRLSAQPAAILYVDDDDILAGRIRKRLEHQGFQVTLARDGRAGLALAREQRFDLIMVDNLMPVMGGLEMLRTLQSDETAPPVVMVTGAGDEAVAVAAMKCGASDYIVKDCEGVYLEMFPVVIEQALSRRRLLLDKQRAEAALTISEGRYRHLFTRMLEGFALLERAQDTACSECSLRFLEINPAFGTLLGIAPENLLGRCVCQLRSFPAEAWRPFLDQMHDTDARCQITLRCDATRRFLQISAYIPQPGQIALFLEDVTARKAYETELERLATTDPLTGVSNRADFFRKAEGELARILRYGGTSSLIMFDLDHFKQVNDRYGHLVGDQVLAAAAAVMQQNLRTVDAVGRYGGEEFVVLLPETTLDEAWVAAERIRTKIAELTVPCGTESVTITTSCGVSVISAAAETTITQVVGRADRALYQAKHEGRNRTVLFNCPHLESHANGALP